MENSRFYDVVAVLTWRKDLDHWLIQEAEKSGVTLEEGGRVHRVTADGKYFRVDIISGEGKVESIKTKFVIGADGATSVVRKSIYPELGVRYSGPVREWYQGALGKDQFQLKGKTDLKDIKSTLFLIGAKTIGEINTTKIRKITD